jgi:nucleoside-diphosphate-sugar epimerase
MKIGVFGANGFIGSKIVDTLVSKYEIVPITRDNYSNLKGDSFDVFINVAGNKRNYWANQYPQKDFKVSTIPVYSSIFDFKIGQYIFMSSIAVYDKESHYGFNKILCEEIIKRHSKNYSILRCCTVIDKGMEIGIINDVLTRVPLFISADSRVQFITREEIANVVMTLLTSTIKNKVFNVGGVGTVKIGELEGLTGKSIIYQLDAEKRHYEMDISELETIIKLKTSYEYVSDVL